MIRSRLTGLRTWGAFVLALAGGSIATAQTAQNMWPYPQTAQHSTPQQYGQYQQTAPPVQPQTGPYTVTTPPAQQPYPQAQAYTQGQTAAAYTQPQATQPVQQQPSYHVAQYQLPNYQAPAPGQRYAMKDEAQEQPESVPPPAPTAEAHSAPVQQGSHPTTGDQPAGDCNCNQVSTGSWEGYVQAPAASYAGCNGTSCYPDCDYGGFGGASCHAGGLGGKLGADCGCPRQWFFGVYGLFMTRDNPSYHKFAASVDGTPAAYPYYPTQDTIILSTNDIEPDWQWGAEIRFGSTFGRPRNCDPCGGCCGQRPCAWEVVYWGLAEDSQTALATDILGDTDRMYGLINYAGLNYDLDGSGGGTYADRPLNDYIDYGSPVQDPTTTADDVRLLAVRVRSNFSAQNLELNFIRFPVAGCGGGCNPCCPSPLSVNALCGVRYLKMDEDLLYDAFTTPGGDPGGGWVPDAGMPSSYPGGFPDTMPNSIFHDINVDNEMVGVQFGGNINYQVGCKVTLFCDSNMGIYGNRISSFQRVWAGGAGEVSWVNSGNPVAVRSDKTDVSFLGEMRAGVGYQVSCNCRLTAAYRVIGITGVALAGEQIPTDWSSPEYVGIIDSNDSIVLHGLQTGVEWKY